MFGVADDLDLTALGGHKLQQISLSEHSIELAFDEDWLIYIECTWRLEHGRDVLAAGGRGRLIDEVDKLNALIGAAIQSVQTKPPDRIAINFDDGCCLILIDDNPLFEAFTIEPLGIVV